MVSWVLDRIMNSFPLRVNPMRKKNKNKMKNNRIWKMMLKNCILKNQ